MNNDSCRPGVAFEALLVSVFSLASIFAGEPLSAGKSAVVGSDGSLSKPQALSSRKTEWGCA